MCDRLPSTDLGVVFALGIEAGGLVDHLSGLTTLRGRGFVARQGQLHGRAVVLIQSGAGRRQAAQATEALIDGHRPRWVFSAGFAGALQESLRRGQIVVADTLVDMADEQCLAGAELPAWLGAFPQVRVGRLLTADHVVRLPGEKRALGEKYAALAVDMESLAVATVCRRRSVPYLAVRVICDELLDQLPPDVEKLLAQKTGAGRLGAAVGSIFRRPSCVKDLWQLQANALLASDRLAGFLAQAITHL
ncbi:MAG: hypothetical protein ABSG68_01885 [Thermoguttaceae bacterium]